jgi:hypothetical protein
VTENGKTRLPRRFSSEVLPLGLSQGSCASGVSAHRQTDCVAEDAVLIGPVCGGNSRLWPEKTGFSSILSRIPGLRDVKFTSQFKHFS